MKRFLGTVLDSSACLHCVTSCLQQYDFVFYMLSFLYVTLTSSILLECVAWVWDAETGYCYPKNAVPPVINGLLKVRYSGYRDINNCTLPVTLWVINTTATSNIPSLFLTNFSNFEECAEYCDNSTECKSFYWNSDNFTCNIFDKELNYLDRSQIYYDPQHYTGIKLSDNNSPRTGSDWVLIFTIAFPIAGACVLFTVLAIICIKGRSEKKRKLKMQRQVEAGVEMELEKRWEINYDEIKIVSEIGQGGYGTVYKAFWRNSDCAVKRLNIEESNATAIKEFLKEASIVRNLRAHKNVCGILGICRNPICIVMEYVDGGSLETLVMQNKIKMTPLVIVRLAKDIASGMSHIHAENILHCDLACRNLLVVKDEDEDKYMIKVTDFGLARNSKTDVYQAAKDAKFPIRWSAPEVLSGRKLSRGADVWSFGVVLWEILEAKVPFFEFENKQVVILVCEKNARLPKPSRVEYPSQIWEIMKECWNIDPTERPSFDSLFTRLQSLEFELAGTSNTKTAISNNEIPPEMKTSYITIRESTNKDDESSRYEHTEPEQPTNYGIARESLFLDLNNKPPTPPDEGQMEQAESEPYAYDTIEEPVFEEVNNKPPTPPPEDV